MNNCLWLLPRSLALIEAVLGIGTACLEEHRSVCCTQHLHHLRVAVLAFVTKKIEVHSFSDAMTKEDLRAPTVKMSSYWNRQICLACFTLVLMAAGFAAVYCGVKFGLTGENDGVNVTSVEDGVSVTPRPAEINPSTPFTTNFTQLENNSTTHSNENVPYVTDIPASSSTQCIPRNETFCSNHINYTHTFYPNFAGDKSEHDFLGSWAFLQTIIDSLCHPRIEEFICLAAQPECRLDGKSIGPCRKLCHEIANACDPYFWSVLEKEKILFNCDEQYVDSTDQNLCLS
ncbi:hypothetical protein OUZ56_009156 [Daphnia magna]|uniref:FZ domain-containing protein n=1 Tax=Daphnia magna TaxID=35525 RepID=A0ABR0AF57_9CRUS|nr:hypothetical protein OUZ56_009156 [Daphnia magna]